MYQDHLRTLVEDGAAFQLTRFDGTTVRVTFDGVTAV